MIATGSIGAVAPGSPVEDVRNHFGEPYDISVSRDPLILKFDALEVTVRDGRVALLHVELAHSLPPFLGEEWSAPGSVDI
jgi:hypothetical protein